MTAVVVISEGPLFEKCPCFNDSKSGPAAVILTINAAKNPLVTFLAVLPIIL